MIEHHARRRALACVLCILISPALAPAQPIVQPAPPVVQPAPPVVQPAPPVVQPAPPAVPIGPAPQPTDGAHEARKTVLAGVWLTGISHGAAWTVALAAGPSDRTAWWLFLPIAGPAVWGAIVPCHGEEPHDRDVCRALTATGGGFWTAIQLAGFVVMLTGLLDSRLAAPKAPRLVLAPLAAPEARGIALWGSY